MGKIDGVSRLKVNALNCHAIYRHSACWFRKLAQLGVRLARNRRPANVQFRHGVRRTPVGNGCHDLRRDWNGTYRGGKNPSGAEPVTRGRRAKRPWPRLLRYLGRQTAIAANQIRPWQRKRRIRRVNPMLEGKREPSPVVRTGRLPLLARQPARVA